MRLSIYVPEDLRIPIERAKGKISLSKLFTYAFEQWQENGRPRSEVEVEGLRLRNKILRRKLKKVRERLSHYEQ